MLSEVQFLVIIYLLQRCLQNCCGENGEYHPEFHLPLLRSAIILAGTIVGKVFKRVWLIPVVSRNWIINCSLFPEILEVLEIYFHFITMISFSYLV